MDAWKPLNNTDNTTDSSPDFLPSLEWWCTRVLKAQRCKHYTNDLLPNQPRLLDTAEALSLLSSMLCSKHGKMPGAVQTMHRTCGPMTA